MNDYAPSVQKTNLPPQSLEAEKGLLGGLMLDSRRFDDVSDIVTEHDFYVRNHALIFAALFDMSTESSPIDVITVSEALSSREVLDQIGGLAYLGELASQTPSAANIVKYATIVREHSILRSLIHASTDIAELAYHPEGRTPSEVLDIAEQKVFDIAETHGREKEGFRRIGHFVSQTIDNIEKLQEDGNPITGLATGFTDLDEKTRGLQPGDLIVVAGRPSMGKTSFCMNVAEFAAIESKKPVAVFSMEMPGDSLAMRLMSSIGQVNSNRLRSGQLNEDDWPRIMNAVSLLSGSKLFVDDTGGLTTMEVRARARRLASEHGQLGLIVIDYLQLMGTVPSNSNENRATEVSAMTRALKLMAKELNVPLIILSQLNRSLEQRPDKRPVMSDLRESGAIEQDADLIMFIYRDEVYNKDRDDNKGTAELIIGKQRNGPIGVVPLTFRGEFTRFENFTPIDMDKYIH